MQGRRGANYVRVHLGTLIFLGGSVGVEKTKAECMGGSVGEWKDKKRMHFLKLVQEIDKTGAATRAHRH